MKLGIFYPWSSPFTFTGFTENVVNLARPPDVEIRWFRGEGWCPARRHNDGCEKALAWGADLILCLGTDQVYPEDLLPRLLTRYVETGGVITAMVPFRGHVDWQDMKPFQKLAWITETPATIHPDGGVAFDTRNTSSLIDPADGDLQRVHLIGSGVLMFHRDHLLSLKKPWFYERVDHETMHRVADMDSRFVWRLQTEAAATVWVDTTIDVKHLHVFSIDETFSDRFADWATSKDADLAICRRREDLQTVQTAGSS